MSASVVTGTPVTEPAEGRQIPLNNWTFDLIMLFLPIVAALSLEHLSGNQVWMVPAWITFVWFFGKHHVFVTFSRVYFTLVDKQEYPQLYYSLPLLVGGLCLMVAAVYGVWLVNSIFFFMQWYHTVRQSYGILRAYEMKMQMPIFHGNPYTLLVFYTIPILGLVQRNYTGFGDGVNSMFLQVPIRWLPVSDWFMETLITFTIVLVAVWLIKEVFLKLSYVRRYWFVYLYLLFHSIAFFDGYFAMKSVTDGFMVTLTWHSAQYLVFTWWFNNRRFESDPQSTTLNVRGWFPWLCQKKHIALYFMVLFILSTLFYKLLEFGIYNVLQYPTTLVLLMLSIYHIFADGVLWRYSRQKVRQTLDL